MFLSSSQNSIFNRRTSKRKTMWPQLLQKKSTPPKFYIRKIHHRLHRGFFQQYNTQTVQFSTLSSRYNKLNITASYVLNIFLNTFPPTLQNKNSTKRTIDTSLPKFVFFVLIIIECKIFHQKYCVLCTCIIVHNNNNRSERHRESGRDERHIRKDIQYKERSNTYG